MKTALLIALLVAIAYSADYDYMDTSAGAWIETDCKVSENKRQSPVNVISDKAECSEDFYYKWTQNKEEISYNLFNNGHTLQADGPWSEMHAIIDGKEYWYEALQFHFHAPSEHTVDGKSYPLEMHIVHQQKGWDKDSKGDQYAVQGFLFDVDSDGNSFFDETEQGLDVSGACDKADCPKEGAHDMIFSKETLKVDTVYHYDGGFTTPPCTGIAAWFLSADINKITQAQLDEFTSLWADDNSFGGGNGNNRPTQGDKEVVNIKVDGCDVPKAFQKDDEDSSVARLIASASAVLALLAFALI